MSARLTKFDREQMAKALVRHKFHEQAEALMQESVELFDAVYAERYDAQTQKMMRQLEKRHPGAFHKYSRITVNANGMRVSIGGEKIGIPLRVMWLPSVVSRPMLDTFNSSTPTALGDRVADYAIRTKKFAEEIDRAYQTALAALNQFASVKKLTEQWPEAMPVIGNLIPASERNLPVVQLTAINDEFGLPPSEAAQAA